MTLEVKKVEHPSKLYLSTCNTRPVFFYFTDTEGIEYYFSLRRGLAKIVKLETEEVVLIGKMKGLRGECTWEDVVEWAYEKGLIIVGGLKCYNW